MLAFLTAYGAIPENITVMQGQNISRSGVIAADVDTEKIGKYGCSVKLFNFIPIKNVNVSVTPKRYVIPSGEAIGIRLYTEGVLVVGISNVTASDGRILAPAEDAGIQVGDRITEVNGKTVESTDDFVEKVNEARGRVRIKSVRGEEIIETELSAVYSAESDGYRVGLWVRDSTAGIGTLTFYDPESMSFAALGHGICDSDTGTLMTVKKGTVNGCNVRGVIKGESGTAGELVGDFSGKELGKLVLNSSSGITGFCEGIPYKEAVELAPGFEAREGTAEIWCDVDGGGPKAYEIEITKVSRGAREDNKNLVLRVTDPILAEKTGGIVQGMSGSPILQNGRLVGAVTHVFVNDPMRGYGIFIENMLDMTEKVRR